MLSKKMREINFRGMHKNRFVYGSLMVDYEKYWIATKNDDRFEVDPETVGQFTGMKDSNGAGIYEGDIIKSNNGLIMEVKYRDHFATFWVDGDVFGSLAEVKALCATIKVIGNIHENPELLERKEK